MNEDCPDCPKCLPGWLAQFADLMSLLLVFFILILSMSVLDQKKIIEFLGVMKNSIGVLKKTERVSDIDNQIKSTNKMKETSSHKKMTMNKITEPLERLNKRNEANEKEQDQKQDSKQAEAYTISKSQTMITIPIDFLFERGEYEMTPNAEVISLFNSIAKEIKETQINGKEMKVIVKAYSALKEVENLYINPKNDIELAAFRASTLATEFIKRKVDKKNIEYVANVSNFQKSIKIILEEKDINVKEEEKLNSLLEEL